MSVPPTAIPDELYDQFTLNKTIPVLDWYINSSDSSATMNWTPELINKFISKYTPYNIHNNLEINQPSFEKEPYSYGSLFNLNAMEQYKSHIIGKDVAVIGSLRPWLEAIIINMGAKSVTTVEYNKPTSTDLIKTITYDEFTKSNDKYDAIFSYSSIEHSGLGRYGDPLNPNGDLETMSYIHSHLNDNGLVFIGVPVGKDALVWNAHRVYGHIRLALLFKGFNELQWFGLSKSYLDICSQQSNGPQPVIVIQKI